MTKRKYGWHRDLRDPRDRMYSAYRAPSTLPKSVDLRDEMPAVYDQGGQGSCVANACAAVAAHLLGDNGAFPMSRPSRSFIYYEARARRGWQNDDSGSYIRDAMKVMAQEGVLPEDRFVYDDRVYDREPSNETQREALATRIFPFMRLDKGMYGVPINTLYGALADGHPVAFGCTLFESFESFVVEQTGEVPMPADIEAPIGGHAMVAVGYDMQRGAVLVRNSWGAGWGIAGHCWMPTAYLADPGLSADFWMVTGVVT